MLQTFFQRHTVLGITYEQLRDEILSIVGEMTGELQVNIYNFLVRVLPAFLGFERCVTCTQLITENPYTPYIHEMIVVVANDDFRRDVVQCAAECYALPT